MARYRVVTKRWQMLEYVVEAKDEIEAKNIVSSHLSPRRSLHGFDERIHVLANPLGYGEDVLTVETK